MARLIAAFPPLICALFMGEINIIFSISGLFAFFLQLFFPAILQIVSRKFCEMKWGLEASITPYTMAIGASWIAWITIVFSVLSLLFSIFGLLMQIPGFARLVGPIGI